MKTLSTLLFTGALVTSASAQVTAPDLWDGLPREKSATLQILWRTGDGTAAKPGPAEIRADTPVTLTVAAKPNDKIRWWQIIPDTRDFYKNANHPWEPDPYKWVGFAKIPGVRRELSAFHDGRDAAVWPGKASDANAAHPLAFAYGGSFYHTDCGTFWFEVEILRDGKILRSAGLAESGERGMSPRVFRLSVRKTDGFLGFLTSYFNVPGLFGCVPWQSHHYVGVDCADVLMAAASRAKGAELKRDWNVEMVVSEWPKAVEIDLADGVFSRELKWGRDIKPGYLVAVRYPGGKHFQHIGALMEDTNKNGILDSGDTVIHAGPSALQISTFGTKSFDGHLVIIRNE